MSYEPKIHGAVLLEYEDKPRTEWTYRLTQYGAVFRKKKDDAEWSKWYDVMVAAVADHVGLVRRAKFQKILVDNYDGPVPDEPKVTAERKGRTYRTKKGTVLTDRDIRRLAKEAEAGYDVSRIQETPRSKERRERMAEAKQAAPKKEPAKKEPAKKKPKPAADKPQRLGARAKKLLEMDLGLTRKQQDEVHAKADAISRARVLPNGRQDGMTRLWDIYEAAGKEMPASIKGEKEAFMKTGVMQRSRPSTGNGAGAPKEARGGKNAASPAPSSGTSKRQQAKPDPKPGNGGPQPKASEEAPESEPQNSEILEQETETL